MSQPPDVFSMMIYLKRCPLELTQVVKDYTNKPLSDVMLYDTYRYLSGDFSVQLPTIQFAAMKMQENDLITLAIGCWLFHHPIFEHKPEWVKAINRFLIDDLMELANHIKANQWLEDDDRAEEFVRLAFRVCNIVPSGETEQEANDRFETLSTAKRQIVLKDSVASLERIKAIRREMAEKKAREAANVYGRE
jgi:hypothetical protein